LGGDGLVGAHPVRGRVEQASRLDFRFIRCVLKRGLEDGGNFVAFFFRHSFGGLVEIFVGLDAEGIRFERFLGFVHGSERVAPFECALRFAFAEREPAAAHAEEGGFARGARAHDLCLAQKFASGDELRFLRDHLAHQSGDQPVVLHFQGGERLVEDGFFRVGKVLRGFHGGAERLSAPAAGRNAGTQPAFPSG